MEASANPDGRIADVQLGMTPQQPAFSVVLPLHNKEPHIVRALDSVLGQSFGDFELVVVNDASTDGSAERVSEFKDGRIRVLRRTVPGPGGYAARNFGIIESRSHWVAFLDADDEWLPDHLHRLHSMRSEFPTVRFFGAGWYVANGAERQVNQYFLEHADTGSHLIDFWSFLRTDLRLGKPFHTSTVCAHKPTILSVGGFPENAKKGGDIDSWFRIMHHLGEGGWSAHLGAVYYRDTINPASRRPAHEAPAISRSIAGVLALNKLTRWQQYLLMRNSNYNSHSAIRLAVRAGILSPVHMSHYYVTANPLRWIGLRMFLTCQSISPGAAKFLLGCYDRLLRRGQ